MHKLRILLTVFLAITCSAFSQDEPPKLKGPKFSLAAWGDWRGEELFILNSKNSKAKELTKVDLFTMNISQAYGFKRAEPIKFYTKSTNPEKPFELVYSVQVPTKIAYPLIVLFQSPKDKKLNHMVFDLASNRFPYGSYIFANITKEDLMLKFDGRSLMLRAKQTKSLSLNHGKKALSCKAAHKVNNKIDIVFSSMLMHRPNKRMILFFYPTKDEVGRPVIKSRSLVDYRSE